MKSVTLVLCTLISIQCHYCHSSQLCFNYAIFPAHIEELRTSYHKIRVHFQEKDGNFKTILLKPRDLPGFTDIHSCQFLKEMLNFYLIDVIPAAKTHGHSLRRNISKIANTLHELNENVQHCRMFFNCDLCSCKPSPHFQKIQRIFKQLQVRGVYKAMGELNVFVDWVWKYINMRRN
ncbi:interleukin-10-like [Narcine bancroftii]|uniref:interleukin-10-like n=1 Tax=Narcine bancroftii TaxID=1343680 RepID=UPI003831BB49